MPAGRADPGAWPGRVSRAQIGEQDVEVNHQTHLATLTLPVNPGPVARFGAIRVSGRPPFSAHHLAIIARFKRGDPFKRSKIDDLRRALIQTTLVANADIKVVPVEGGRIVDLDVRLEPAPSHTIAGELGYGTGQGARLEASWTDRNFFNPEGALTLRGIAGTTEQLLGVQFRRSNFVQRDQTLNAAALRVAPEVRRLFGQDHRPHRQHRAAEQFHLAEEVDLVLRRRVARRPTSAAFSTARASRTRGLSSLPPRR